MRWSAIQIGVLGVAALLAVGSFANAYPQYYFAWRAHYPTSTIPDRMAIELGSVCFTCHHPPDESQHGTCYRADLIDRLNRGMSIQAALIDLDDVDSDGDGVSNYIEATTPRYDAFGNVGYHQGLVGESGVDPCGADPNEAVTNQLETPPSPGCPNPQNGCDTDITGDCQVGQADLAALLAAYNTSIGDPGYLPEADFDADGSVGQADLAALLADYGNDCN